MQYTKGQIKKVAKVLANKELDRGSRWEFIRQLIEAFDGSKQWVNLVDIRKCIREIDTDWVAEFIWHDRMARVLAIGVKKGEVEVRKNKGLRQVRLTH